jgi:hypothetical protein
LESDFGSDDIENARQNAVVEAQINTQSVNSSMLKGHRNIIRFSVTLQSRVFA